jgi:alkylation response protein AidB-like acyl-CoA dehydrogenase
MWATNCSGWEDRGADLQCLVCRHSPDGKDQDPEKDPADSIMILLITPSVIAASKPDAYQVIKQISLPGHTSTNGAHIKFSSFRVPEHNVLAGPGKAAAAIIAQSFTSSAALVGAMSVGIMAAAFEAALEFAKRDSRGGKEELLNRQSVADLLMDVKMRADAARFLTWKAADAIDKGLGGELALEAKIWCSDMAVKAVVDAMSAVGMWVSLVMYILRMSG